jgi:hypothetical protein
VSELRLIPAYAKAATLTNRDRTLEKYTVDPKYLRSFRRRRACHHPGQLRPSPYLLLPERTSPDPLQPLSSARGQSALSTTKFKMLLPQSEDSEPFYRLNGILHDDLARAEDTMERLQMFDANDDVLAIHCP